MIHTRVVTVLSVVLLLASRASANGQPGPAEVVPAAGGAAVLAAAPGAQDTPSAGEADAGADLQIPADQLKGHVPDAGDYRNSLQQGIEVARRENDDPTLNYLTRVLNRVDTIRRPQQLSLTLEDALRRALEHSYAIDVQSYNPAVETTRVVEAQAAFDAVFFSSVAKNKVDKPTGSELVAGDLDFFDSTFGVRKLLPSGAQVSGSYGLSRTKTTLVFQQLNPEYFSDLALELRQPLLRGFGIDYNRAFIVVAKNDRRIGHLAFRRQVRDTVRQVEELYWRLVQARRDVVTTSRLLADFERIYEYLQARRDYDIMEVQLAATRANLEQARADFVARRAGVFDAEDRLIAAINDPDMNLADTIEIIPVDFPRLDRIVVDRLAEVQTALDNRPEIKEQRARVASAKIAVGRAKIDELPRFDLLLRYTIDGIGGTADRSLDDMTGHNFVEYLVGVELDIPVGNRGPRAAHHRARLQHAQAAAQLKAVFEEVILDVNVSARRLATAFDQIGPTFESIKAREREVESIVARAERKDLNTLNTELNARQSLAASRRNIVGAVVDYNIAVIDLERAKGTLLRYYNILIPTEDE